MRWQRGHDRPLHLGKILFAEDFFVVFNLQGDECFAFAQKPIVAWMSPGKHPVGTEINPTL
ncbi:hypothetical protein AMS59_16330 [Lysinibacillus sp. FJAT-14745]|nr:hypothetical protein AMS59_16330 [Lysinibacillus sp. FJAT-14745]